MGGTSAATGAGIAGEGPAIEASERAIAETMP